MGLITIVSHSSNLRVHTLDTEKDFFLTNDFESNHVKDLELDEDFAIKEMYSCLGDWIEGNNPEHEWIAAVVNFGWRKTSGTAKFKAENGFKLLVAVLPNTSNTFNIYKGEDKVGPWLVINNFHHDSPTGDEWYLIRPLIEG